MLAQWKNTRQLRPWPRLLLVIGVAAWLGAWGNVLQAQEKPREPAPGEQRPEQHSSVPAPEAKGADQAEGWRRSIALVEVTRGHGSGFVVKPGIVATNSHVIEGEFIENVKVRFVTTADPNPKQLDVKLLYENSRRDLALLQIQPGQPALKLAQDYRFAEGKAIAVLGNPGQGGDWARINTILDGTTVGHARAWGELFFELKVVAGKGTSGGPVLDRNTGEVIGVQTANLYSEQLIGNRVRMRPTDKSFCIPVHALLDALAVAESPDPGKTAAVYQKRHLETLIVKDTREAFKRTVRSLQARIDLATNAATNSAEQKIQVLVKDRQLSTKENQAHKQTLTRVKKANGQIYTLLKGNGQAGEGVNKLWQNYQQMQELHYKPLSLGLVDASQTLQQQHERLLRQVVEELQLSKSLLDGVGPD